MAFKLGSPMVVLADKGVVKKKLKFKSDIEVQRTDLGDDTLGEAHPGKIIVDSSVKPGSALDKKVQAHEKDHVERMATGEAAFDDNTVTWQGVEYQRKNGKIKYKNRWRKDGWEGFPWEKAAIEAEKNA